MRAHMKAQRERHLRRMKQKLKFSSALLALALGSCADAPSPVAVSSEPSMYHSLAAPGAEVDADAARSMLSLYRANKGLGALVVDPGLQRIAEAQAHGMAADGKISHIFRKVKPAEHDEQVLAALAA